MAIRTKQYFLDKFIPGYKLTAADLDDLVESVTFSTELTAAILNLRTEILGGASGAYDTLLEIENLLKAEDTEDATTLNTLLTAIGNKQATLVSGTNIKTVGGTSILGTGDIPVTGGDGHTHSNKTVLDATTASFTTALKTSYDSSVTNAHSHSNKSVLDATTASFTTADETKLDGIANNATANSTDATLLSRANHTGTQTSASISDFIEAAQDAFAALIAAGTHVNLTPTYDDAGNRISFNVTAGGGSTDPEVVRDTIGTALVGTSPINIAINDAGDTITFSTTATVNSTDAQLRDRSTHTGTQVAATISDLTAAINTVFATNLTAVQTASGRWTFSAGLTTSDIILTETTLPANPATNTARILLRDEDNRSIPTYQDANGFVSTMLPGYILIFNNTGVSLTKGQVVTGATASASGRPQVVLATSADNKVALGVVYETIANNSAGFIRTAGSVSNMDTSAWTDNTTLYKGTGGTLTSIKPTAPSYVQVIATVVRSHATQGRINVEPSAILNDDTGTNQSSFRIGNATQAFTLDTTGITAPRTYTYPNYDGKVSVSSPTRYDVRTFGAVGNDSTDNTTALNNALAAVVATGGELHFPIGSYRFTTLNAILSDNVSLLAEKGVKLRTTSTTGNSLTVGAIGDIAENFTIKGFTFQPVGVKTAGSEIRLIWPRNFTIEDIIAQDCYKFIESGSTHATQRPFIGRITRISAERLYQFIHMYNTLDLFTDQVTIQTERADAVAIHLDGGNEGCTFGAGQDVIGGVFNLNGGSVNLLIKKQTFTTHASHHNKFIGLYLDSHNYGARIEDGWQNSFTDVYFCADKYGAYVLGGAATQFTGCQAVFCGEDGFHLAGGVQTSIANCLAQNNNQRNLGGASRGAGVVIHPGASYTDIQGLKTGNQSNTRITPLLQKYGVYIESGADTYSIIGGSHLGNTVDTINDKTNTGTRIISDVLGVTPINVIQKFRANFSATNGAAVSAYVPEIGSIITTGNSRGGAAPTIQSGMARMPHGGFIKISSPSSTSWKATLLLANPVANAGGAGEFNVRCYQSDNTTLNYTFRMVPNAALTQITLVVIPVGGTQVISSTTYATTYPIQIECEMNAGVGTLRLAGNGAAVVSSPSVNYTGGQLQIESDTGQMDVDFVEVADTTDAASLKANLASPTFTGTVVLPSTTSIGNVTSTEIGYVDGVTSAIQTQLDSKAPVSVTIDTKAANYTLVAGDNGKIIEVSALATITLPNGLATGFRCDIVRTGTGVVTISATTTLRNGTANKINTQYKGATVYHVGSNVWQAIGTEA